MRVRGLWFVVFVVVLVVVGCFAAPAFAGLAFSSSFDGEPGAVFSHPWGIDVDGAAGRVLVADSSHDEVAQFDAAGGPVDFSGLGSNELAGAGAPEGFGETTGVAGAPGGGDVYVADFHHNVVDVFNAAGEYVSQLTGEGSAAEGGTPQGSFSGPFQVRVAPSTGDVWVVDSGHGVVDEFEPEEEGKKFKYLAQIEGAGLVEPLSALQDVALDSEGNVYVAGSNGSHFQVDKFSAAGVFEDVLDPNGGTSVAVDTATVPNYVFTLDGGKVISKFEATSVSGVPVEQFGAHETELQNIGVDSVTGVVYATDYNDSQVDVFSFSEPPEVPSGEEAKALTSSSAKLTGVLNPANAGTPGEYEFLYRESKTECKGESATTAATATGEKEEPAEAEVTGLLPNATYTFCLLARNGAGETAVGAPVTFTMPAVKLTIDAEATTGLTSSSANLTAKINPNGADTTYHFEYGTSTSYEASIPVPDASIGSGRVDVPVSQQLTKLTADTTYHWRLVADSVGGTFTGPDHTFYYDTSGAGLPDGRQYEMVTPPQKNGALISSFFAVGGTPIVPQIAEDGHQLIAVSIQCFADAGSCVAAREQEGEPYEFSRMSQGWATQALAAPATRFETGSVWAVDAEEGTTLFSSPSPPEGGDDFYVRNAAGVITNIGPLGEEPEGSVPGSGPSFRKLSGIVATSDFSHVIYGGAKLWSLDGQPETEHSLYEYVGSNNTAPVAVGVSGGEGSRSLISSCGTLLASGGASHSAGRYGSLSADGRTVYFTAQRCPAGGTGENVGVPVPAEELYARIDGEAPDAHTVLVSGPTSGVCTSAECIEHTSNAADAGDSIFTGASHDGSRVFFTSPQQLSDQASEDLGDLETQHCTATTGSGCNLYESECPGHCEHPGERRLVDVSAGAGGSGGPRVQGVMAISPDGSHVYFVAKGKLTAAANAQGHSAVDGEENLYMYSEGHLAFITTLPESDKEEWERGISLTNVTPEGRFLVFMSHGALTADDTRPGGPIQVYRYDAQTGALIRVSIGEHAFNDNGNAGSGNASIAPAEEAFVLGVGPARSDPTMSHNGEYVFFESPNALTSGALDDAPTTSGLAENVYEYHDGSVSLISDGKDATLTSPTIPGSVQLLGSDATGANVFFATNDPLVPQDTDTQRDFYDAHICSDAEPCIAPATQPPPPCQEEACHTPTTTPSSTPLAGSSTFQGPGNLPAQQQPATAHATILTRTAHAGKKFTLRLKLPLAGSLSITSSNILKASDPHAPAGTHTLQITLTHAAQRALHHKHKLTLKLHITYTTNNTTTTTTATITLKP